MKTIKKAKQQQSLAIARRTKLPALATFTPIGPFYGMTVPDGEIQMARGLCAGKAIVMLKTHHNKTGNVHALGFSIPSLMVMIALAARMMPFNVILPMPQEPEKKASKAKAKKKK